MKQMQKVLQLGQMGVYKGSDSSWLTEGHRKPTVIFHSRQTGDKNFAGMKPNVYIRLNQGHSD